MKKMSLKIAGTIAVLAFATQAFAQDNQKPYYGSIGYFLGEFEADLGDGANGNYDILDDAGADIGDFTIDNVSNFDSDFNAAILRFGYQFHPNFSVEGRYGIGLGDDKGTASVSIADGAMVEVTGGAVANGGTDTAITNINARLEADTELDSLYGVFLRAGVSAGSFYPYAIIGYTEGKGETTNARFIASGDVAGVAGRQTLVVEYENEDDTESDFSYGIGADFHFGNNLAANAEWMSYLDKDGAKIGGFQIGLVYSF